MITYKHSIQHKLSKLCKTETKYHISCIAGVNLSITVTGARYVLTGTPCFSTEHKIVLIYYIISN